MGTTLKTGLVRLSYAHLFTQRKDKNGKEVGYGSAILLPQNDESTKKEIDAAIEDAILEGMKRRDVFGGIRPNTDPESGFRMPLRNGNKAKPNDETYKDMWFFSANAKKNPPVCYLKDRSKATSEDQVYSGCWGKAKISFYAYNHDGNLGVACSLEGFIKLKDDTRLSGSAGASEDDFADDFEVTADFDNDDVL